MSGCISAAPESGTDETLSNGEWITRKYAAELLGIAVNTTRALDPHLEGKKVPRPGVSGRRPVLWRKADVEAVGSMVRISGIAVVHAAILLKAIRAGQVAI